MVLIFIAKMSLIHYPPPISDLAGFFAVRAALRSHEPDAQSRSARSLEITGNVRPTVTAPEAGNDAKLSKKVVSHLNLTP